MVEALQVASLIDAVEPEPTKVIVIAGFLGSGKTTLIERILK